MNRFFTVSLAVLGIAILLASVANTCERMEYNGAKLRLSTNGKLLIENDTVFYMTTDSMSSRELYNLATLSKSHTILTCVNY